MMTYYDQDHHVQTTQLRARLVRALRERTDLHVVAGLVSNKPLSGDLADLQMAPLSYPDYLRNLARARIVIYIRGVHDCHSFKLPEYLAMGKPIVGQRLLNNADTLYANAHFDEQFAFEEAAEIVDTVAQRLADPPWLDAISAANAHTFDEEIGPTPGAELILQKIGIAIDPRHT